MTKAEQARVLAWRLKIRRYAQGEPRQVARTCRHLAGNRRMPCLISIRCTVEPFYGFNREGAEVSDRPIRNGGGRA